MNGRRQKRDGEVGLVLFSQSLGALHSAVRPLGVGVIVAARSVAVAAIHSLRLGRDGPFGTQQWGGKEIEVGMLRVGENAHAIAHNANA